MYNKDRKGYKEYKKPYIPNRKKTLDEMIEDFLKSSKDRQEKRDYSNYTKKRKKNNHNNNDNGGD